MVSKWNVNCSYYYPMNKMKGQYPLIPIISKMHFQELLHIDECIIELYKAKCNSSVKKVLWNSVEKRIFKFDQKQKEWVIPALRRHIQRYYREEQVIKEQRLGDCKMSIPKCRICDPNLTLVSGKRIGKL